MGRWVGVQQATRECRVGYNTHSTLCAAGQCCSARVGGAVVQHRGLVHRAAERAEAAVPAAGARHPRGWPRRRRGRRRHQLRRQRRLHRGHAAREDRAEGAAPAGGCRRGAGWGRPSRIGSRYRLCVPAGLPHACCQESLDRLADDQCAACALVGAVISTASGRCGSLAALRPRATQRSGPAAPGLAVFRTAPRAQASRLAEPASGGSDGVHGWRAQAEIPHVEEHVSKIDYVGVQTQNKLLDIAAAAHAVGISGINAVHNSITTGAACARPAAFAAGPAAAACCRRAV